MRLFLSRLFSAVFVPLFIPIICTVLVIWSNEFMFGGWQDPNGKGLSANVAYTLFNIAVWTLICPGVGLLIMKKLNLIGDLNLSQRTDRIMPYFLVIVCYSIAAYAFVNQPQGIRVPGIILVMLLGSLVSIIISFFLNNFLKVSAHANGMGSFVGVVFGLLAISVRNTDWLIVVSLLLTGAVLSSRLYLKAHTLREVFLGFSIGFGCQILALMFFQVV